MTETWKRNDNITLLYNNNNDFTEHNVCQREVKTAKRNYGGISILSRKESYSDGIIWSKLSKENTKTECDTYLCCAYIPPKKLIWSFIKWQYFRCTV